jgi:hypothetical protein
VIGDARSEVATMTARTLHRRRWHARGLAAVLAIRITRCLEGEIGASRDLRTASVA